MRAALAQAETFSLQLAMATPVAELEAWFAAAAPGHRATYAVGIDLPRSAEGVRQVQRWVDAGLVETFQERDQNDHRRWRYQVRKLGAVSLAPPPPPRMQTPDHRTREELRKLLSTLRACAERGRACPSNAGLARALGLGGGQRGRDRAKYLMECLAARGEIASESRGRNAPRVVTILAAGRAMGKSTLGECT